MTRILVAAAAISTVLATTACGLLAREPDVLLVGVALDLTGDQAAAGTVYHNAIQLQLEQTDGELGQRRLELVVRDNRSDPNLAAENLAELAGDRRLAAIITAGCARCVQDAAPGLTVPLITLDAADEVARPAPERRWVFKLGPNAGDNADRLSQGIAADGARTVAVIATGDAYGQAGVREMSDAARRDRLTVVAEHEIRPDDASGITAAAEAVATWQPAAPPAVPPAPLPAPAGPDAVVVWVPAPASGTVAAALREAGYDGRLYLDTLAADTQFLPAEGRFGDATLVFTSVAIVDRLFVISPAAARRRTWFSTYLSRHGAYHLQSSWAADALAVVVDAALRTSGAPTPTAIRDQLEATRIDGITGQIRYTVDQHSGLHPGSLTLLTTDADRWR